MKSRRELSSPLLGSDAASTSARQEDATSSSHSPIEQVSLTVPTTDDPSLPPLTFRTCLLGPLTCALLSFLNQFFYYRTEPLTVSSVSAQLAVVPVAHLLSASLPTRPFFRGQKWEFTLNPGPFNVKEHVLITIFANAGAGTVYAIHVVSAVKLFYNREMGFWVALVVVLTTQVLGFGWAGLFRRYLVEPASMWWPQNLVQVSLFRYVERSKHIDIRSHRQLDLSIGHNWMICEQCFLLYFLQGMGWRMEVRKGALPTKYVACKMSSINQKVSLS